MSEKQQTNTSTYVKPAVVKLGRMGKFVNDNTVSYVADGANGNIGGKKVLLTKPS